MISLDISGDLDESENFVIKNRIKDLLSSGSEDTLANFLALIHSHRRRNLDNLQGAFPAWKNLSRTQGNGGRIIISVSSGGESILSLSLFLFLEESRWNG